MTKISKEYSLEELKKLKSRTDVKKFNATTEKDILEQTISDKDTPNISEKELKEFAKPENRKKNNED